MGWFKYFANFWHIVGTLALTCFLILFTVFAYALGIAAGVGFIVACFVPAPFPLWVPVVVALVLLSVASATHRWGNSIKWATGIWPEEMSW